MAPLIRLSLSGTESVQILADIETIDMEAITDKISESNKLGHHKLGKVVKLFGPFEWALTIYRKGYRH